MIVLGDCVVLNADIFLFALPWNYLRIFSEFIIIVFIVLIMQLFPQICYNSGQLNNTESILLSREYY